jgi:type III restriction enzyme
LRREVGSWRTNKYLNTTCVSRELLMFWFENPERHPTKKLFYAQREAVEAAVWLNEVAANSNVGQSILTRLREAHLYPKTEVVSICPVLLSRLLPEPVKR